MTINNGSGATLNRVTGGQISDIQGRLSATGSVYLMNPQGVVVGPGGKIVAEGTVALTSRDISSPAFMAGGAMTASGTSVGDVTNLGWIASKQGSVLLIGHAVTNQGAISAVDGQVDLAAANSVLMTTVDGVAGVYVAADAGASGDITEDGRIKAAAAALTAAGGNVYTLAGNRKDLIEAQGTATIGGQIWLSAPNGQVQAGGGVVARNADGSGGRIVAAGSVATTVSGALDASGTQGGQVLVGVTAPQTNLSDTTTIADGAVIRAGGPNGGGSVETSGHALNIGLASVDAGRGGSWLLDPTDLLIDSTAAATIDGTLNGGANVSQSASGNITISAALSWTTVTSLTLAAGGNGAINAPITAPSGTFTLTAGGAITSAAGVSVRSVTLTSGGGGLQIASGSIAGSGGVQLGTTGAFQNDAGAGALSGPWRIYSANPANDSLGGLDGAASYVQYDTSIGGAPQGSGNGLIYSLAPTLGYSVAGSSTKTYDGTAAATGLSASSNLAASGLINGDSLQLLNSVAGTYAATGGTGTYSQSDVGSSLLVTLSGAPRVTHNGLPVYGYGAGSQQLSGVIGAINPLLVTVTAAGSGPGGSVDKIYDGSTAATLTSGDFTVSGLPTGQGIIVTAPTSALYDSKDVASATTVTAGLGATSFAVDPGATSPTKLTNYLFPTSVQTAGHITQAPLIVLGVSAADKQYDGTGAATLNLTHEGLYGKVIGDDVSLVDGAVHGVFVSVDAGANIAVDVTGYQLTGAQMGNYSVAVPLGEVTASISRAPLNITGVLANDKIYDGTLGTSLTYTGQALSGVTARDQNNTTLLALVDPAAAQPGTFSQANVGRGLSVTTAGFTLSGSSANDYVLAQPQLTANINPAQLTVSLDGSITAKTYDGSAGATIDPTKFTVTGWAAGEAGDIVQVASATYQNAGADNANAGAKDVRAVLEVTDFHPLNSQTLLSNYTVGLPTDTQTLNAVVIGAGKGLINQAPLTINIVGNPSKVYDGGVSATLGAGNFQIQGFVGSENASVALTAGSADTAQYDDPNAGQRGVSVTLTNADFATTGGALMSNYSFINPITGQGTITRAPLGFNPIFAQMTGNPTKTYDGNTDVTGLTPGDFTLTGWVGGDTGADVQVTKTTGTYASKNVGVQPVTVTLNNDGGAPTGGGPLFTRGDFVSTLSQTNLNNYTLPDVAFGSGTINPAVLTATITTAISKVYNRSADAVLAPGDYTISSNLAPGEHIDITQTDGQYQLSGAADFNAGTKDVFASIPVSDVVAASGTLLSNYILPTTAIGVGKGMITQAPLTILGAAGTNKTYDRTDVAAIDVGAARLFGVVAGDGIVLNSPTTGTYTSGGSPVKDAGSALTITPDSPFSLTASAQTLANYTLTQPTLTGMITPITLQVSDAAAVSRPYNGTASATVTGANLSGVLAGDTAGVALDSSGAIGQFKTADAGSAIPVTASGFIISGSLVSLGDYVIAQPSALAADITPKTLTAQIVNDPTKTYDGSLQAGLASANFQILGWVNGEGLDVSVIRAASSAYTSVNAAASVGVSATLEIPDFSATTTKLTNYALPTTATGTGTINRADLVGQIIGNPTKVYDGGLSADPTNSGAKLLSSNYRLLGFATGEGGDVTVTHASGTFNTANAGIDVITAMLSGSDFTATATDLNNYNLPATAIGAGTITPKQLSAAIIGVPTKTYDGSTAINTLTSANFNLTGFVGSEGTGATVNQTDGTFNFKDVLTGNVVTAGLTAGDVSAASANLANYILPTTASGAGAITAKALTLNVSKVYDSTTVLTGATYTLGGVVGGDAVSVNTAGTAGQYNDPNANTGVSMTLTGVALQGADLANYALAGSFTNALIGTITKRDLTVGLTDQTKTYDGTTNAVLSAGDYVIGGLQGGQTVQIDIVHGNYNHKDVDTATSVTSDAIGSADYVNGTSGFNVNNYTLPTSATGNGLITAQTLTIDLTKVTKVYDATNVIGTSSTAYVLDQADIVSGDQVFVTGATGTFDDIHVNANPAVGIGVNISAVTLGGAQKNDYVIAAVPADEAIGFITPATLTLSVTGGPTKGYDGTASTAPVNNGAGLQLTNFSIAGLQGSDTVGFNGTLLGRTAVFDNPNVVTPAGHNGLTVSGIAASDVNFSGALARDYTVASMATGNGTITPLALSIVLGAQSKTYDGTAGAVIDPATAYGITGFLSGQTGRITQTTGTYRNINVQGVGGSTVDVILAAGDFADVGSSGFLIGNYSFPTLVSNTASTIGKATLGVSLNSQTKVYDGSADTVSSLAGDYVYTGLAHGETVSVGRTSGDYNSPNVRGATTVTVGDGSAGNAVLTSADYVAGTGGLGTTFNAGNYNLPASISGVGSITPVTLAGSIIGDPTKTYDGAAAAALTTANYGLTGFVNGEGGDVTVTKTAASYASQNAGAPDLVTVALSTDPSVLGSAHARGDYASIGTDLTNYVLPSSLQGNGEIDPRALSIVLGAQSKTYDGTAGVSIDPATAYGITGFVSGQTGRITQTTGTYRNINVQGAGGSTVDVILAASDFADVGSSGFLIGNYSFPTLISNTASTIGKATLGVSLNSQTKVYDGSAGTIASLAGDYVYTGLAHGETVSVGRTSGDYNSPNVRGATTVTVGDGSAGNAVLTAADYVAGTGGLGTTFNAGNYNLPTSISGVGSITPATLTAGFADTTKVYDRTLTTALLTGYGLTGFVAGQSGSISGAPATGLYGVRDVTASPQAITVSLAGASFHAGTGVDLSNYVLPTTAAGSGTITPAPLRASGLAVLDKVYDGTTVATLDTSHAGGLAGVYSGDDVTLSTGPSSAQFVSPNAATGVAVNLSGGSISGAQVGDYYLVQTMAFQANITPRPLAASIVGAPTKVYDGGAAVTLTAGNYQLTGFVPGQGGSVFNSEGTYASPNAGPEAVTAGLASGQFTAGAGTSLSNYILPTSASGVGAITPAPLTALIVGNPSKLADGNASATLTSDNYQLIGFIGGQGASVGQTAGTYASANPGKQPVTALLGPGDFTVTGGANLANYILPSSATGSGTISTAHPDLFTDYTTQLAAHGVTLDAQAQRKVREIVFAMATPRIYIPFPAPGALSTWKGNGFSSLPIIVDQASDYALVVNGLGDFAVQSGPPLINNTEQVLLQGVRSKRYHVTFAGRSPLGSALGGGQP